MYPDCGVICFPLKLATSVESMLNFRKPHFPRVGASACTWGISHCEKHRLLHAHGACWVQIHMFESWDVQHQPKNSKPCYLDLVCHMGVTPGMGIWKDNKLVWLYNIIHEWCFFSVPRKQRTAILNLVINWSVVFRHANSIQFQRG